MSGNRAPILWYENVNGERWYPPENFTGHPTPEGFVYQVFRNPFEVHTHYYGPEGKLGTGTSTYSGPLALALSRPTLQEMAIATARYGSPGPRWPLDYAILRAAESCGRCMNVLIHRAGLPDGYREGSVPWQLSNTECEYCKPKRSV